jgi:hypothetical protein
MIGCVDPISAHTVLLFGRRPIAVHWQVTEVWSNRACGMDGDLAQLALILA